MAIAAVSEADALVARRTAESIQARQALEHVNAEADRIRARSEQDQAFGVRLAELDAARGRLEARIEGLDAELARLEHEESRRKELAQSLRSRSSVRRVSSVGPTNSNGSRKSRIAGARCATSTSSGPASFRLCEDW